MGTQTAQSDSCRCTYEGCNGLVKPLSLERIGYSRDGLPANVLGIYIGCENSSEHIGIVCSGVGETGRCGCPHRDKIIDCVTLVNYALAHRHEPEPIAKETDSMTAMPRAVAV